jgi:hypothetical protein
MPLLHVCRTAYVYNYTDAVPYGSVKGDIVWLHAL